jgi:hypothetical protein
MQQLVTKISPLKIYGQQNLQWSSTQKPHTEHSGGILGFLEDREIVVNFKGATSSKRKLPGGCPQGTGLGMFLFIILINATGFRNRMKNNGQVITSNPNKRKPMKEIHLKFIDDMTTAVSINIKQKQKTEAKSSQTPQIPLYSPLPTHTHTHTFLGKLAGQVKHTDLNLSLD